jgi:hypothetical protein
VEKNLVNHNDDANVIKTMDDFNKPDEIVVKISQSIDNIGIRKQKLSIISDTRRFSHDVSSSNDGNKDIQITRTESEPRRIKVVYTLDEPVYIEKVNDKESVRKVDTKSGLYFKMFSKIKQEPFYVYISNLKLIPRLKKRIPLSSVYVRILLPFCYASLGVIIY